MFPASCFVFCIFFKSVRFGSTWWKSMLFQIGSPLISWPSIPFRVQTIHDDMIPCRIALPRAPSKSVSIRVVPFWSENIPCRSMSQLLFAFRVLPCRVLNQKKSTWDLVLPGTKYFAFLPWLIYRIFLSHSCQQFSVSVSNSVGAYRNPCRTV